MYLSTINGFCVLAHENNCVLVMKDNEIHLFVFGNNWNGYRYIIVCY